MWRNVWILLLLYRTIHLHVNQRVFKSSYCQSGHTTDVRITTHTHTSHQSSQSVLRKYKRLQWSFFFFQQQQYALWLKHTACHPHLCVCICVWCRVRPALLTLSITGWVGALWTMMPIKEQFMHKSNIWSWSLHTQLPQWHLCVSVTYSECDDDDAASSQDSPWQLRTLGTCCDRAPERRQ